LLFGPFQFSSFSSEFVKFLWLKNRCAGASSVESVAPGIGVGERLRERHAITRDKDNYLTRVRRR
jgi:hypothetical protein